MNGLIHEVPRSRPRGSSARHRLRLNASDCESGTGPCDHARLTPSQTRHATTAEHQRNAQNRENGWGACDHSKLTPSEARQTASSEHQRNLAACKDDQETCDYSQLTTTAGHWATPSISAITPLV
jgi:hypothetical protein